MNYDVVIVGGGIAGLTAAAFLNKEGLNVVLCEKEAVVGGLVNSFEYKGFVFDGGIRAIENSGVVFPMLKQLGLEVEFLENDVSIGIENDVVKAVSKESIYDYQKMLQSQFPDHHKDIDNIIAEILKIMKHMDILYGIDNPLFMDVMKDKEYLYHTLMPWLFRFISTIGKIQKLQMPVDEYLKKFTNNQVLIDLIAQHFFAKTPAFFAMSYFSLYLDYKYPKGGTGSLISKMENYILLHHGELKKNTEIMHIDPHAKVVVDQSGNRLHYRKLIWASDMKMFYQRLDTTSIKDIKTLKRIAQKKKDIQDKVGGDSIVTTFVTLNMDKKYFEAICSEHFFYTPQKKGLSNCPISDIIIPFAGQPDLTNQDSSIQTIRYISDKKALIDWLVRFYDLTTYEISCPVMRDETLAPQGQTGLIISTLMEYTLVKHIFDMGWYDEFKEVTETCMLRVMNDSIFPGIQENVMDAMVSTPLTIEKLTGNSDGAITGWAFTNAFIPAINSIHKVTQSVLTPFSDIYQAGQWTYSPAGFPISVMTGKIAADKVMKDTEIKKVKKQLLRKNSETKK